MIEETVLTWVLVICLVGLLGCIAGIAMIVREETRREFERKHPILKKKEKPDDPAQ